MEIHGDIQAKDGHGQGQRVAGKRDNRMRHGNKKQIGVNRKSRTISSGGVGSNLF
jgi:hypothetical protein